MPICQCFQYVLTSQETGIITWMEGWRKTLGAERICWKVFLMSRLPIHFVPCKGRVWMSAASVGLLRTTCSHQLHWIFWQTSTAHRKTFDRMLINLPNLVTLPQRAKFAAFKINNIHALWGWTWLLRIFIRLWQVNEGTPFFLFCFYRVSKRRLIIRKASTR